ncbi:MAG: sodium:solute symporter [Pirellulaceae bacterium]
MYLPFFRRLNATTAYEYLELRFDLLIRRVASLLFILLQLGRIAVVIFLPALALSTATDFDVGWCILVMGVLVILYSVLGGVEGVIWTDVLQTVVLMGGAAWALVAILVNVDGGAGALVTTANEHDKFFQSVNWDWDLTHDSVLVIVVGSVFANLFSYTASQDVVQRYVTTRDERTAARAIWTGFLIAPIAQAIFFAIGTALFVYYRQHPAELDMTRPIDGVFPQFIVDRLPVGVSGLVIAAIFAAAQSTLSSTLNSVSAAVVTDFYRPWFPSSSDARCLAIARGTTVVIGLLGTSVALVFTSFDVRSQWELFLSILGLFGGTVAGLFALGIFDQRATSLGALLGAVASILIVAWLKFFTPIHYFIYPVAGVIACVGIGTIISRLLPPDRRDLTGLTWATLGRREESTRS